jgi:hypothetical protein
MANAAARVLELFLETPNRGVAGVTHVTGRSVTPESQVVTTVTPVTYQGQQSQENGATDSQPDPSEQSSIRFEERAAIIEHDGGAPRAWAEALARLDPSKPPGDVPPQRWLRFIDDCGRFLEAGWAVRAAAFGWGPLDLFGCDRERPFARVDHLGLLWLVNGGIIVELHRDRAILETEHSTRQSFRRRPIEVGRIVLAWKLDGDDGPVSAIHNTL